MSHTRQEICAVKALFTYKNVNELNYSGVIKNKKKTKIFKLRYIILYIALVVKSHAKALKNLG